MNNTVLLESESFRLSLDFQVFESDISYPSNTILSVSVASDGFLASAKMEIDIKSLPIFFHELQNVYDSLSGEAKIREPYGNDQYIAFSGDKKGHILVSGTLSSHGANGFWQELKFENRIDQTFLPPFLQKLQAFSNQYVK